MFGDKLKDEVSGKVYAGENAQQGTGTNSQYDIASSQTRAEWSAKLYSNRCQLQIQLNKVDNAISVLKNDPALQKLALVMDALDGKF